MATVRSIADKPGKGRRPRGSVTEDAEDGEGTSVADLSVAARPAARGGKSTHVAIAPPNLQVIQFDIRGNAPYVQNRFAAKADIMKTQQEGSTAKSKKKREPKDFVKLFKAAQHISTEGWNGIPAPSFRNAMIEACRLVNFHMTKAKMSIFIIADGFDAEGNPLVKLDAPKPEQVEHHVRNDSGVVDIRSRPMWKKWKAKIKIQYDGDQFTEQDVANLLSRAGQQVGIGEGRPFSKDSAGMGWGTFTLAS